MNERERQHRQMIEDFPDSTLPWFSLGRYLVEQARFAEAIDALRRCVAVDDAYAAAWIALGDAYAGLEENQRAREAYARCADVALTQGHPTLAADARERADELA